MFDIFLDKQLHLQSKSLDTTQNSGRRNNYKNLLPIIVTKIMYIIIHTIMKVIRNNNKPSLTPFFVQKKGFTARKCFGEIKTINTQIVTT